jgi:hypothetical protein
MKRHDDHYHYGHNDDFDNDDGSDRHRFVFTSYV